MIARLALIDKHRQDEGMTTFIVFVVAIVAIGLLSLRYGADSRLDKRNL
jgi:hypothetical protein